MGRDKRLIPIAGVPMLRRVALAVAAVVDDLMVVIHPDRPIPAAVLDGLPARILEDRRTDAGPLAGLEVALLGARHDLVVAAATDMPWLEPRVVRLLCRRAEAAGDGVDATVVRGEDGRLQPLLAVYRWRALATVAEHLAAGDYRMGSLLDALSVEVLEPDEWRLVDAAGRSLGNVNDPTDVPA